MKKIFILIMLVVSTFSLVACVNEKEDENNYRPPVDVPTLIGVNATNSLNDIQEIGVSNTDSTEGMYSMAYTPSRTIVTEEQMFPFIKRNLETMYVQMDEPVWIIVHIQQPEDRQYLLWSVTVNGIQYQIGASAWPDGPAVGLNIDATKIWIPLDETKDLTGTYTIDNVKYTDNGVFKNVDKDPDNPDFISIYVGKPEPMLQGFQDYWTRLDYDSSNGTIVVPLVNNAFELEILGYDVTGFGTLQKNEYGKIQLPGNEFPEFVELSIKYKDGTFVLNSKKYYSKIIIRTGDQLANLDRNVNGIIYLKGNIHINHETWTPFTGDLLMILGEYYQIPDVGYSTEPGFFESIPLPKTKITATGDILVVDTKLDSEFNRIEFDGNFEFRSERSVIIGLISASESSKLIYKTLMMNIRSIYASAKLENVSYYQVGDQIYYDDSLFGFYEPY